MRLITKKTVLKTRPFDVEEVTFEFQDLKPDTTYSRLHSPDWVNVLPVLPDGRVLLIEQPRIGSMSLVMETVGGVIDPGEKDPTMAAARELEEETGFTTTRIMSLGSINPNPAIMTNNCHFFIALNCMPASPRKHMADPDERISVHVVDPNELEMMIRTKRINHALSALCIFLAQKYLPTMR